MQWIIRLMMFLFAAATTPASAMIINIPADYLTVIPGIEVIE
jgi:hypothetical protein